MAKNPAVKQRDSLLIEKLEKSFYDILTYIGEDPEREGLVKTPNRVAKAYEFLTNGYKQDVRKVLNDAIFT